MIASLICVLVGLVGDPGSWSERERAAFVDRVLERRLDVVVPELMRREEIDLWVLVAREYDEDPVVETMLPATWLSARRRTILVFHDPGEGRPVERLAVARYDVDDLFATAWDPEEQPDQWAALAEILRERDPERIGIDVSPTFALADGLSASQAEELREALGPELWGRTTSAERLCIGWLETRIPEELEVYPTLCAKAHEIIAAGFSDAVVEPGTTTTEDLEWWFRQRIRDAGLDTWFQPSVSLQRNVEGGGADGSFASDPEAEVVLPGDLLHVDIGITYLTLNTDTQQHAYVLRPGEEEAPAGLRAALAEGNAVQDRLIEQFRTGRTGNEILAAARAAAIEAGLRPTIYTHPLGLHGHAAGPTIGLWDQQGGVPGPGDYELFPSTCFSIELSATTTIPEWNDTEIRIMLEEDAVFDGERVRWLDGRQERFHLIGSAER